MEYRTRTLTAEEIAEETNNIIRFLQAADKSDVEISFGWGCNVEDDALYQPVVLQISAVSEFIAQSVLTGDFVPGSGDLYIESADKEITFMLCHEADIHLKTENIQWAHAVTMGWIARGYACYEVADIHE